MDEQQKYNVGRLLLAFARVVCVVLVVFSALAFPETLKLLNGKFHHDINSSTLYVPLVICSPSNIDVDGTTISFDASELGCFSLDFLVNACACSLALSVVAVAIYLLIDITTRCGRGPFKRSSLAGMGLFLFFIVLQTAFCVGALVKQAEFWRHYSERWIKQSNQSSVQVKDVKTYGNTAILMAAAVVGFFASVVIFVEFILALCYRQENNSVTADARKSLEVLSKTSNTSVSSGEVKPEERMGGKSAGSIELGGNPSWTAV